MGILEHTPRSFCCGHDALNLTHTPHCTTPSTWISTRTSTSPSHQGHRVTSTLVYMFTHHIYHLPWISFR